MFVNSEIAHTEILLCVVIIASSTLDDLCNCTCTSGEPEDKGSGQ